VKSFIAVRVSSLTCLPPGNRRGTADRDSNSQRQALSVPSSEVRRCPGSVVMRYLASYIVAYEVSLVAVCRCLERAPARITEKRRSRPTPRATILGFVGLRSYSLAVHLVDILRNIQASDKVSESSDDLYFGWALWIGFVAPLPH
jgi:hypothetical protein